jgi:hypothetical protein
MSVVISTKTTNTRIAQMSLDEFMRRLELPRRPVTVDIDWFGDVEPAGVTIYLESDLERKINGR